MTIDFKPGEMVTIRSGGNLYNWAVGMTAKVTFIDECQDLNTLQHLILRKLIKTPNGRFIAVGDKNQALYSFLGADTQSFEALQTKPKTTTLPLSICYRCGRNIIKLTNTIYDTIEVSDDAEDGVVDYDGSINDIQPNDIVLCRNTSPLIELYFYLISIDKRCYIKGRDTMKGLLTLIESLQQYTLQKALEVLDKQLTDIVTQLKTRKISKPKDHQSYINLLEKVTVIKIIAGRCRSMQQVALCIEHIFSDEHKHTSIILSTIHKAKGLEYDNVFLIRRELIPSKYAKQQWQLQQEQNLLYVAYSRAKKRFSVIKDF